MTPLHIASRLVAVRVGRALLLAGADSMAEDTLKQNAFQQLELYGKRATHGNQATHSSARFYRLLQKSFHVDECLSPGHGGCQNVLPGATGGRTRGAIETASW